jgi:hypothetical protein
MKHEGGKCFEDHLSLRRILSLDGMHPGVQISNTKDEDGGRSLFMLYV